MLPSFPKSWHAWVQVRRLYALAVRVTCGSLLRCSSPIWCWSRQARSTQERKRILAAGASSRRTVFDHLDGACWRDLFPEQRLLTWGSS